jgi:Zn-dependent oligopeptidase
LAGLQAQFRAHVVAAEQALRIDAATYERGLRSTDDRAQRHALYEAFVTRASDRGPLAGQFDNGPIIDEILALRHEHARLAGFPNYAEWTQQTRASRSADALERHLLELNARIRPRALAELEEAWALAKSRDALKGFRPWDLGYYLEKARERRPQDDPPREAVVAFGEALGVLDGIEVALFDLRVHRDYVPADRASRLRSHVLDTLAQVRREVSLLLPPPWERRASSFIGGFGSASTAGGAGSLAPSRSLASLV